MAASNLEILDCELTPLGLLCLRRRRLLSRPDIVVTEVTLDHEFLMSSYITVSERALATRALEMHKGRNLSVLVGGLGLGYTAYEVLTAGADRVTHVDVVEYLAQVIAWVDRDMIPLAPQLRADERLALVKGDVYARLGGRPERTYDVILIDVDHSPDHQLDRASASFYTPEGLRRAREHLSAGGILGVWSYAEHSPFSEALREVFDDVRVEAVPHYNDLVDEELTDWLFLARS
jgi:spermidine synthase